MKSKATSIIERRDNLSKDINKYWSIINLENVMPRTMTRHYDLKNLFEQIKTMANQRAEQKLKALCINMGFKKFSDLPEDCIQRTIFELSEFQELKVRLGKVRTLSPKLKASKGKKKINKTEALTSDWIAARLKEIEIHIIGLKQKIANFNETNELEEEDTPATKLAA